jgi:serine/alanine adding enzyme
MLQRDGAHPAAFTDHRVVAIRITTLGSDHARWDDFARAAAAATYCHLAGWKTVIERVFGHECVFLQALDDDGTLLGLLPLVRVQSRLFGRFLVSMPFLNAGGPIGERDVIVRLVDHALALAQCDAAALLELRCRWALPLDLRVSHRKVTTILELPPDPALLWNRFSSKLRAQIRRPRRDGITVRFGREQARPFFQVFARNMRDLGTPTQSLRLFDTVADTFAECWFGCAYDRDTPVAGACGFRWRDEVEVTWASALTAYKPIGVNMLLYWALMERAIGDGVRRFNFGRSTPGSGPHRFKLQWGARDEVLWWYSDGRLTKTPSPDDRRFAWGPRVWRHLPVPIANRIGPRIARFIP